jgi:hypothetical protein
MCESARASSSARRIAGLQRRLVVICPPGPVRRIFECVGLDGEIPMHASRTAAQRDA